MKMNRIDGSKISPMAIIARVSVKHKIAEPTASESEENFTQIEAGQTGEMEEIKREKEIGETKESEKSNIYTHMTEPVKTNYIDCSKKSPNSILAGIYTKKPKNSQCSPNKIIKDEEKKEDIAQSLKTSDPDEAVNPYIQVVLISSDEDGESCMEHSNTRNDECNGNSVNENEPKIIEIPSEVITSFLNMLNTNDAGVSLDSLIKITKAPKTEEDIDEAKRTDENICEDSEDESVDEYNYEDSEDESADEYNYEDSEDESTGEYNYEDSEDKSADEYNYEDKSIDEYYCEDYEDKSADEYCYEDYELKNTDGYCEYYESNLADEFCSEIYEDNNESDYYYEYQ
ncbi:MAG TPA: hypothetical protein PK566_07595 [Pseudobacteroides sp.]|nr:hypothetical protein [Pseudobacteroides sp.]